VTERGVGVGVGDHREAAAEIERSDQLGLAAVERVRDHHRARGGGERLAGLGIAVPAGEQLGEQIVTGRHRSPL